MAGRAGAFTKIQNGSSSLGLSGAGAGHRQPAASRRSMWHVASIAIELPGHIDGYRSTPVQAARQRTQAYFIKYGGSAQKAFYGPHQLLMVRTSAPLRHLHAPDECLRGLGMKVEYLGMRYTPSPAPPIKPPPKTARPIALMSVSSRIQRLHHHQHLASRLALAAKPAHHMVRHPAHHAAGCE